MTVAEKRIETEVHYSREGNSWVVEAQKYNRQDFFDSKKIFQGRVDFWMTIVRNCKNNWTRKREFETEKLEKDLTQSKMCILSDFSDLTEDEIFDMGMSIFAEIKKGERFYLKISDSVVALIQSPELGLNQVHLEKILDMSLLPAGSYIFKFKDEPSFNERAKRHVVEVGRAFAFLSRKKIVTN